VSLKTVLGPIAPRAVGLDEGALDVVGESLGAAVGLALTVGFSDGDSELKKFI